MSEQNKKVVRIVRESGLTNPSVLDGFYTGDYVYHGVGLLGDLKGLDAFKAMVAGFVRGISDLRETVVDLIAEGDSGWRRNFTSFAVHKKSPIQFCHCSGGL